MSSKTCSPGLAAEVWRILTWADRVLVLVVALATVLLLAARDGRGQPGVSLRVEASGSQRAVYPLSVDRSLRVQGPMGVSQVEIAGGAARMTASPCPEQRCVQQGWIRHRGEVVVCAPNRILLQIDGAVDGGAPDAVSR